MAGDIEESPIGTSVPGVASGYSITASLLLFSLLAFAEVLRQLAFKDASLDSYIWPLVVSTGSIAIAVPLIVVGARRRSLLKAIQKSREDTVPWKRHDSLTCSSEEQEDLEDQPTASGRWRATLPFVALSVAYIAALQYAGFIVSTLVFYAAATVLLTDKPNLARIILGSLIGVIVLVGIFLVLVGASVPAGVGMFARLYSFVQEVRFKVL